MSEQRKMTYKYVFPESYNPVYITGAHGGTTPRGDIVANFFLERHPLPKKQKTEISAEGVIGSKVVEAEPENLEDMMVRFVQTGIVLDIEAAESIKAWLQGAIDTAKEVKRRLGKIKQGE